MKALTLHSEKSNFYSTILRIGVGIIGLIYFVPALADYLSTYELTTWTVINGLLGLVILLVVIFNPTFGANINLTLNDEFMRIEEAPSFIRTAHWNQVNKLTLTRFSIRIRYRSGAPERFRLPFTSIAKHRELREWLRDLSQQHEIQFIEKAWWKPF